MATQPRITYRYVSGDAAMDAGYTIRVNGREAGDIQVSGRVFVANVWTSRARDEMAHGPMRRAFSEAQADAARLLRQYGWTS